MSVGLLRPDGTRIDVDLERLDEVKNEHADMYASSVPIILFQSSYGVRHDIDERLQGKIHGAIHRRNLKPSYIAQNLHKDPTEW